MPVNSLWELPLSLINNSAKLQARSAGGDICTYIYMNQQIDWPGIRANAVHLGIRAAARAAAANLPPNEQERFVKRTLKRAEREKWEDQRKAALALATKPIAGPPAKPMSSFVVNGSTSAANVLAERKHNTRTKLAEYAEEAAEEARIAPNKLKVSRAVKDVASVYSTLWPEKDTAGAAINVWSNQTMIQA